MNGTDTQIMIGGDSGWVTIGTCSLCHGPVQIPKIWMGTVPPVPTCGSCGATARPENYGPVIPMTPSGFQYREPDHAEIADEIRKRLRK